jgi:hypothetical protein
MNCTRILFTKKQIVEHWGFDKKVDQDTSAFRGSPKVYELVIHADKDWTQEMLDEYNAKYNTCITLQDIDTLASKTERHNYKTTGTIGNFTPHPERRSKGIAYEVGTSNEYAEDIVLSGSILICSEDFEQEYFKFNPEALKVYQVKKQVTALKDKYKNQQDVFNDLVQLESLLQ